jgi:predicted RNA-binding protein with PUA-like domain
MPRSYWLVKSEPGTYAWERLVKDGGTCWDGVRNHAARGHLAAMRRGDLLLFYHSGKGKEVVGVARVRREHYPDPTADDPHWVAVDVEPVEALREPVPLAALKGEPTLRELVMLRQGRLSVSPVRKAEFDRILRMGKTKL